MTNEELQEAKIRDKERTRKNKEEFLNAKLEEGKPVKIKLPDYPKHPNFLDDETRENIKNSLKEGGVEVDNLSDNELLAKLQTDYTTIRKIKDDLIESSEEKSSLAKHLNSYLNTPESLLTDKAFVARLFNMGVPACFLKLFRDADTTFTDSKIWEIIRHSGIKVYEHNLSELLSRRRPINKTAKQLIQNRLSSGQ